jgi:hypothetical protein
MSKPKFNPIVTRIKLNPEQAVLACSCYTGLVNNVANNRSSAGTVCARNLSSFLCRNTRNVTRNSST